MYSSAVVLADRILGTLPEFGKSGRWAKQNSSIVSQTLHKLKPGRALQDPTGSARCSAHLSTFNGETRPTNAGSKDISIRSWSSFEDKIHADYSEAWITRTAGDNNKKFELRKAWVMNSSTKRYRVPVFLPKEVKNRCLFQLPAPACIVGNSKCISL